ncbi:MAG TPA: leucine-rich repeat domain-containing protein [Candidatus Baltobacteraceae bacterium]|jgi:hypothetical protein|nr:leucine-rich repeat domain-containing protein [Candidatus Baltobacteraceae bacterium]
MKKNHRIIQCLALMALLVGPVMAQAQFSYETNGSDITLALYTGSGGAVTISNFVTTIGSNAFAENGYVTTITIPDSVTNIQTGAFSISSVTEFVVNAQNADYSSLDGVLFNKTQTALIHYPGGNAASSYTIPNNVTNIGDFAFYFCSLTSVKIPGSLTSIGDDAFCNCALTNVAIPDSVTTIGDSAFQECEFLNSATIGSGVTNFGDSVFSQCYLLTHVTMGSGATSIGPYEFYECFDLAAIKIPNSVATIEDGAFLGCPLTSLVIPTSLTTLGNAFAGCPLTNVTIPDSLTTIGDGAFSGCSLTSVTIPDSVTTIGYEAFSSCEGLTTVTIPESVTNIGAEVFYFCFNLTNITVDPSNLFYSSAAGVLFDKNQTALVEAPVGISGSYTVPNTVTSISAYAFDSCRYLTSVTIGGGVTSIGGQAFGDCISLRAVYFQGNAPTITNSEPFDEIGGAPSAYYLPGTTGWGAFNEESGLAPAVLWNPHVQTGDASFGVVSNQFGFNITGPNNLVVVVEACTNLSNPVWVPVATNTLTGGASYFSDPQWTNYPNRFYGVSFP